MLTDKVDLLTVKQRFGIIGNTPKLNRALETITRVAPTELTVLITGESGTGKEIMPKIIHQLSARKHGKYIAVNCGAIPEGTIDSELFGHEKGSFTGAQGTRKGYFEEADGGTIFLDEVAELPLQTQVRLLRVLETGEYMKVGSSNVQKTNVRIVAATNVNIPEAMQKGRFREDLYYRLNTVPVQLPALRERGDDIHLLFRKFSADFAEKYRMPQIHLSPAAIQLLNQYSWPGNIRQLKNITEQISVIEKEREIGAETFIKYLPEGLKSSLPAVYKKEQEENFSEREILYKVLFDLKNDVTDLKKLVFDLMENGVSTSPNSVANAKIIERLYENQDSGNVTAIQKYAGTPEIISNADYPIIADDFHDSEEITEESLSLEDKEKEMITKALNKYHGKRKYAANELGISERTLYRKIKEYNLK